jgi:proteasome assembly chaperone (PAC2) family protein
LTSDRVRWGERPHLRTPVVLTAFEGWNDAGEGATAAVRALIEGWHARMFADIDPEEFFDFTAVRPEVRLVDGRTRRIEWPSNAFWHAKLPNSERDVVLLLGVEPGLRWRTFCDEVLSVVRAVDAQLVVSMGALLADVPHTRPVRVVGAAESDDLVQRLRLRRSSYEGPTGIVGVLHDACRQRGVPSLSLWATVPTYVPGPSSPAATLALVRRVGQLLDEELALGELQDEATAYTRRIDEIVEDDDDLRDYVRRLEAAADEEPVDEGDPADSARLIAEVERFLREQ